MGSVNGDRAKLPLIANIHDGSHEKNDVSSLSKSQCQKCNINFNYTLTNIFLLDSRYKLNKLSELSQYANENYTAHV